jgi:hypothetical protein
MGKLCTIAFEANKRNINNTKKTSKPSKMQCRRRLVSLSIIRWFPIRQSREAFSHSLKYPSGIVISYESPTTDGLESEFDGRGHTEQSVAYLGLGKLK